MSTIFIGIAGGTGSGKTTLTRHLKEHFGDADVRILRRALRDIRDRGRTLESVITQYLTTVKPMHEQYVEPSRKYADIIVLEGGHNLVALDMIMQRIASHIASED